MTILENEKESNWKLSENEIKHIESIMSISINCILNKGKITKEHYINVLKSTIESLEKSK